MRLHHAISRQRGCDLWEVSRLHVPEGLLVAVMIGLPDAG